jgi:hypothetical protein
MFLGHFSRAPDKVLKFRKIVSVIPFIRKKTLFHITLNVYIFITGKNGKTS